MTAFAWDLGGPLELPDWLRRVISETGFTREGGGRRGPWGGGRSGPPWGQGFPWNGPPGQGGPGPWPSRGPRAGRGDVRSAVLALLTEQPMHGYQIIQEIGRRSGGSWKPSPGSVYPTLQQLEDEGLVRAEEQEGRRVFRLTADGEQLAADRADEFASLWEGVTPSGHDTELGDLVFGVATAFVHVVRTGSPQQMADARRVLARTRADLYQILGDRGPDDASADRSGNPDDGAEEGR